MGNPEGICGWKKPDCFVRSASRISASAAACAASSSSENGDTNAGCTPGACSAPGIAGLTTTTPRLPPRDGEDLKPEASSTADIDTSDRAMTIWSAETPREFLVCFFFMVLSLVICEIRGSNPLRIQARVHRGEDAFSRNRKIASRLFHIFRKFFLRGLTF
jgi:hypothetical protein